MNEPDQTQPDKNARTWGMLCHLLALSGFCIPFGNVLGPLIVWAIKKDEDPFIDDQGKEAINFQLTVTIAVLVSLVMVFILVGFLFLAIICIYTVVMVVVAAIKANDGEKYRYPYTLRFFN